MAFGLNLDPDLLFFVINPDFVSTWDSKISLDPILDLPVLVFTAALICNIHKEAWEDVLLFPLKTDHL